MNLYNQIKIVLTSANQPGKKYKLNFKMAANHKIRVFVTSSIMPETDFLNSSLATAITA